MAEIYQKQRRILAVSIYLLSAFWGFHLAMNADQPHQEVLFPIIIAAAITLYCLADAKTQHKRIPALASWLIFMIWPIAAPICLFWINGKQKALRVILR